MTRFSFPSVLFSPAACQGIPPFSLLMLLSELLMVRRLTAIRNRCISHFLMNWEFRRLDKQ
jgi:hypothetical protein